MLVRDCLKQSIEDFSTNQSGSQVMRRFATEAPAIFAPVAVRMLIAGDNSAGYRYLAALVLWQPTLFRQISNPWIFTKAQAIQLSRRLMAVDSSFDIRFARQLPARNGRNADTLTGQHAERALEILDEISPGRRVIPVLSHLARDPDQKISARATLVVGRRVRNVAFTRRLIAEQTDPRVRANAIEAIWGELSRDVRELFWECVEDSQNRVVGNAMVGLYLMEEPRVVELVNRYARSHEPDFRRTSAWAMGRMGDNGFVPALQTLVKDHYPAVRGAALQSLEKIQKLETEREKLRIAPPVTEPKVEQPKPSAEVALSAPVPEVAPPEIRLDGKFYGNNKIKRVRKISEW